MKPIKAAELDIPERYILWTRRDAMHEWSQWDSPFHNLGRAIDAANSTVNVQTVVVSTSTGLVVWDSEERK